MRALGVLGVLVVLSRGVAADPAPEPPGRVSESTALGLSVGTTLAGVAAIGLAAADPDMRMPFALTGIGLLLIGPTTGHAYAGNTWNTGLQVRLVAGTVTAVGLGVALAECGVWSPCSSSRRGIADAAATVALVGGLTFVGATLYEMGSAGASARKRNRLRVVPTGVGVSAMGTF